MIDDFELMDEAAGPEADAKEILDAFTSGDDSAADLIEKTIADGNTEALSLALSECPEDYFSALRDRISSMSEEILVQAPGTPDALQRRALFAIPVLAPGNHFAAVDTDEISDMITSTGLATPEVRISMIPAWISVDQALSLGPCDLRAILTGEQDPQDLVSDAQEEMRRARRAGQRAPLMLRYAVGIAEGPLSSDGSGPGDPAAFLWALPSDDDKPLRFAAALDEAFDGMAESRSPETYHTAVLTSAGDWQITMIRSWVGMTMQNWDGTLPSIHLDIADDEHNPPLRITVNAEPHVLGRHEVDPNTSVLTLEELVEGIAEIGLPMTVSGIDLQMDDA